MANTLGIVSTPLVLSHPDGDIEYVRLLEGTSERLSREQAEARATYIVPYERRMDFLSVIAGAPVTPGDPWTTPMEYPDIPGIYAEDWSIEPRGLKYGAMPYLCAKIEVTFRNPVYDYSDETLYTLQYQGSASIITEPWGTLKWDDDGKYINVDGGRVVGTIAISLTRYRLVNIAAVNALFDSFLIPGTGISLSVNNATFLNYPAGHVAFANYSTTETATIFGTKDITATATLLVRSVPWNAGIKPTTGEIVGVSYDDGTKPYYPKDFSALLS